jgi:hypothetical protein
MPLRDHFHAPLSKSRHWENLHSAWANALRDHLNRDLLPPEYFAEVEITLGSRLEIDVATFKQDDEHSTPEAGAVAVLAPPRPPFTAPLQFTHPDLFEVRVLHEDGGPRLVAALELVSPANKDRAGHRHAFAVKCGSYLQSGLGVAVVDVVTSRAGNLHADILQILQIADDSSGLSAANLYATSYRTAITKDTGSLEYWGDPLVIGNSLPSLPLWVAPDLCLTLNLEETYMRACESSRIDTRNGHA